MVKGVVIVVNPFVIPHYLPLFIYFYPLTYIPLSESCAFWSVFRKQFEESGQMLVRGGRSGDKLM